MSQEPCSSSYRARIGREVFDVPLEWRVESGKGALICIVYDEVTAMRIAAVLNLAEQRVASARSNVSGDRESHPLAGLLDVVTMFVRDYETHEVR